MKTTGKLPSPPGVALAIIELCREDNATVENISRAVRADPALSGRIIKFAIKQVNDKHGHDIGDMLLPQIANVLRKELRAEDVICRMGGEEFLVISTDTGLVPAVHLAEPLRVAAASAPLRAGNTSLHVTFSVGVAQREAYMQRVDELLKIADNALYAAKAAGRNQLVVHRDTALAARPAMRSSGV